MTTDPTDEVRALLRSAHDSYFEGRTGPTTEYLERVLEIAAQSPGTVSRDDLRNTHRNLGILYSFHHGYAHYKAVPHFEQAVELGTEENFIFCKLFGCSLFLTDKYENSISWLKKAIEIDPDESFLHKLLGIALVRTSEAKNDYRLLELANEQLEYLRSKNSTFTVGLEYYITNYFPSRQRG
jgi:tetratricopeptide (TPR) repeat protein